jgi:hypothetical protein
MNNQNPTSQIDLRDYFAGLAMCNAVSASGNDPEAWMPLLAKMSYRLADEMLKAKAMSSEELCGNE